MNNEKLREAVWRAMELQCEIRGYAAPVDVLMGIGILSQKDYESWRFGQVRYLEEVCRCNLSKLSLVLREMRAYAQMKGLKPSLTSYVRWGKKAQGGGKEKLQFSKSGRPEIERMYATHFVDQVCIAKLEEVCV